MCVFSPSSSFCAEWHAERKGEGDGWLAPPVAEAARPPFPQPQGGIGRPQTTLDELPANFLRHYPQYKKGAFNLTELARLCDISRTTAYKFIGLMEG